MATYKRTATTNTDTYSTLNADGSISGKVGIIKPGDVFSASDLGSVLKILSGPQTGRYVKDNGFTVQVVVPPPPPPTGAVIVLTEADGRIRYFDERI
jgi:hypothetical protein